MDPMVITGTLSKLISAGMSLHKAVNSEGFDGDDLNAIKSVIDNGTGLASLWKSGDDSTNGARHLALTTRAFGMALARHWAGSTRMVPGKTRMPDFMAKLWDAPEHERRKEIETRIRQAAVRFVEPGDKPVSENELELLNSLSGNPLNNPYYEALWKAFSNPKLDKEGEESPLMLKPGSAREFERHFRLAYTEAMASPVGRQVQAWRLGLAKEKPEVLRYLLAEDLAAWGKRHVFGNVRERLDDDVMPTMPLDEVYVEPRGEVGPQRRRLKGAGEPILDLLLRLMKKHPIVVVQAHFGHGKSLTARKLVSRLAKEWLESPITATKQPYPVFVKCVRDLEGSYQHRAAVRRALWNTAQEALEKVDAEDSPEFDPPNQDHAVWVIVDGLDEVAFGPNQLRSLFRSMRTSMDGDHRAVIFTRPGALHRDCVPEGVPVVHLHPFDEPEIEQWLKRWGALPQQNQVSVEEIRAARVMKLAQVPILLLMIATTWHLHTADGSLKEVDLYENFFQHIARGKYDKDKNEDQHDGIKVASAKLLERLTHRDLRYLEDGAHPVEAMLWTMSRVAWEAHRLAYQSKSAELRIRHVETILEDEIGVSSDTLQAVKLGVLVALQYAPDGERTTLLFGHQSFREFLVARYWKHQLLRGIRNRNLWPQIEQKLMMSRLLVAERKAFVFLSEMLRGKDGRTHRRIVEWAEDTFNDEKIVIVGTPSWRDDQRVWLRESALAIGSTLSEEGLQANDELTLRSLLAGFFLRRQGAVWAPRLRHSGACLWGANLLGANLREADLLGANLREADLLGANLREADLQEAGLWEADLRGAHLQGAHLQGANLQGTNLLGAHLQGAHLQGAKLLGANLWEADLRRADLQGAHLQGANLRSAKYDRTTVWPDGFRPDEHGAVLVDSDE